MPSHDESRDVFINCPFDDDYQSMLYGLIFAVHDCGFVARSALEIDDAGEIRIDKIRRLIKSSRYSIHDISLTELDSGSGLPRFNMPIELGLTMGAKAFGGGTHRKKAMLILERTAYLSKQYCSDIAGQDVRAHNNDPARAVTLVRNWLSTHRKRTPMPSGSKIGARFSSFIAELPTMCEEADLDPNDLTFTDYTALVVRWLKRERALLIRISRRRSGTLQRRVRGAVRT